MYLPCLAKIVTLTKLVGVRREDLGSTNMPTYNQPNYVNIVPMAIALVSPIIPIEQVRASQIGIPPYQDQVDGRKANSRVEAQFMELTKQLGNLQVNLVKTVEKKN